MPYPFPLEVEVADIPDFIISNIPPETTPVAILNEDAVEGLPDRIIQNDQGWSVTTKFKVAGAVSDLIGPGTWTVHACLINLCDGTAAPFDATQPYSVAVGPDDYEIKVSVPAGAVTDGIYKLHVSVDLDTGATVPVSLFGEGPMMKFYTPS